MGETINHYECVPKWVCQDEGEIELRKHDEAWAKPEAVEESFKQGEGGARALRMA